MRLFHLARHPTRWLRALLVACALGFGLNAIAHVSHAHEAAASSSYHASCGYCVHFGHLVDAPRHARTIAPLQGPAYRAAPASEHIRARASRSPAQPRAPPFS